MRPRPIRIDGDVAYVPLTKGFTASIDATDVPIVQGFSWSADVRKTTVYAVRRSRREKRVIGIHQAILPAEPGLTPDHIDGDGLNNRRSNIRAAT
jgi:hypothetical protein